MTLNYKTMTQKKNCLQLNIAKKIKIKIDKDFLILYVNDYFAEVSGFKISEVIFNNFDAILDASMPKITTEILEKSAE